MEPAVGFDLPDLAPVSNVSASVASGNHLIKYYQRLFAIQEQFASIRSTAIHCCFTSRSASVCWSFCWRSERGENQSGEGRNRTMSSPTTSLNTLIFKGILMLILQGFKRIFSLSTACSARTCYLHSYCSVIELIVEGFVEGFLSDSRQ
ncbi:MAG: hypothetical protein ABSE16_01740 [Verrucomicrobiota bacterium]|jgi:hypothetical protein